ncbi:MULTISPECIES: cysteine--tRNA ligase [Pseudomonas]|uniref:cysteine--tRNA ligase n=1 Tax=Pseudomonas TaxID=286 RepID=UPI000DB1847B|nr:MULTISPECIES: cysteine--tRNA ligase [Pseudomonas]MCZ9638373.1 cysteine--tRNA ligase [Pseudomonas putida]PZQ36377.1 MAG: cysteine--tRNA ligase [Pseudomonas putida]QNL86590.1 Cysteinyl-tRNA synthetase [Pseudomonas putida]
MSLILYDTWTRSLRPFESLTPEEVGLYCCGPTVYDYAHLGNLRTFIFEDVLRRVLQSNGYSVRHIVNITDVGHLTSDADEGEDKMEKGSRRQGESAWVIAERFTAAFQHDWRQLNLLEPTLWCRATDHIAEQISLIEIMETKGFTYRTSDGIYFDTSRQDTYGYLARLNAEGLRAGARVATGEKRSVTDFALWKFSPTESTRQMEWDSPWGVGFPGWHIECSAMSTKYLSPWFDIHCGGEDHISVHHSNEIAQGEACYGTRPANFWMHGAFLTLDHGKMSKSDGEFLRLQSLIDRGLDPLAYRYLCLTAHYRSTLRFSNEALRAAATALRRLRSAFADWPKSGDINQVFHQRFLDEVNLDLNLPRALAVVWALVKSDLPPADKRATLLQMDRILGLDLENVESDNDAAPADIFDLIEQQRQARKEKNWALADLLREQLKERGWVVKDDAVADD